MAAKKKITNKPNKYNQPKSGEPILIDIGCGKNKKQGFLGVDIIAFEGVDVVMNAGKDKWPWNDGTVDEVHASHFVEHLEPNERIHFVNELYRVLKKPEYDTAGQIAKGKATIIVPHWASQRAYGDLTHKWPAVSEFWFYYLDKDWRKVNAPHSDFEECGWGYKCHLQVNWGYNLSPTLTGRNQEFVNNALQNYKEAASDTIAIMSRKD